MILDSGHDTWSLEYLDPDNRLSPLDPIAQQSGLILI